VLLDDFDNADKMVRRMGANGVVPKIAYREWPLFREYRKSEQFRLTFEEIFREPLNLFDVRSPDPVSTPKDVLENGSAGDIEPSEDQ
jgi:hypothetical protein